ncbi:MAG: carbonic anhydrase [bacterium]
MSGLLKCSATIITCIDYRIQSRIREFSDNAAGKGRYDYITLVGGVRLLVRGSKSDREFIIKEIEISVRLHGPRKIILVAHTDCGAYGGRSAFTGQDAEFHTHRQDLQAAKQLLNKHFPKQNIELWIIKYSDTDNPAQIENFSRPMAV